MKNLQNQFAIEINQLDAELKSSIKTTIEIALKLGEKLIAVKAALPHGDFQSFIESNCTVKYRQAAKYMRLAANWDQLSKVHSDALLELSIDDSLRLIENKSQHTGKPAISPWSILCWARLNNINENRKSLDDDIFNHKCAGNATFLMTTGMHFCNELLETIGVYDGSNPEFNGRTTGKRGG